MLLILKVFDKNIYTAVNDELKKYIQKNNISKIYLCGFDTDACVQKTAIDLFEQNYDVYVLKDYCMSHLGKETHDFHINNLARLIGKDRIISALQIEVFFSLDLHIIGKAEFAKIHIMWYNYIVSRK